MRRRIVERNKPPHTCPMPPHALPCLQPSRDRPSSSCARIPRRRSPPFRPPSRLCATPLRSTWCGSVLFCSSLVRSPSLRLFSPSRNAMSPQTERFDRGRAAICLVCWPWTAAQTPRFPGARCVPSMTTASHPTGDVRPRGGPRARPPRPRRQEASEAAVAADEGNPAQGLEAARPGPAPAVAAALWQRDARRRPGQVRRGVRRAADAASDERRAPHLRPHGALRVVLPQRGAPCRVAPPSPAPRRRSGPGAETAGAAIHAPDFRVKR